MILGFLVVFFSFVYFVGKRRKNETKGKGLGSGGKTIINKEDERKNK